MLTSNEIGAINLQIWKEKIPQHFSAASSVWIYQSNQPFKEEQEKSIQQDIDAFVSSWLSHKKSVKAWGTVLFKHFIILMADETLVQVSGCSKDSMIHCIQSIQKQYNIDLLNRTQLAFIKNDAIEIIPIDVLAQKIASAEIDGHTLYFNNTINNKHKLLHEWIVETQHSWLKQKFEL